jgi:hypothetical protein
LVGTPKRGSSYTEKVLSSRGNRLAVTLASLALFFSLTGNITVWVRGEQERGRIEQLSERTNSGLVCLLERARALNEANASNRSQAQVEQLRSYYNEEIEILGGSDQCANNKDLP